MTTAAGTVLAGGRYRLVERLAVGGMGEVWRARDESLGREVAIKVLKDEYAAEETFRTRFRAEARNTAGLSHPGIATMYDYNEEAGLAYLVMELVPGRPLSEFVAHGGRLGPDATLDIVAQASQALQAAHEAGLIHRDMKPGNIIIQPDGLVKVTDFGIARVVNAATLTQTGTVLGTAQYVSPEQAQGRQLTAATDIYSLGVVAYQCLAGHVPFSGESAVAVALAQVREEPPPLPGDVPAAARELIGRCLDKDPQRRPGSAGELADLAGRARQSLGRGDTEAAAGTLAPTVPGSGYPAGAGALAWGGTSRFGTAATPGGSTRVEDATLAAGAGDAEDGTSRSPKRRRLLLTAGVASAAVLCAVLLTLGLGWGALFGPSGDPGGDGKPPGGAGSSAPPDSESGDGEGGREGDAGGQADRQAGQDAERDGAGGERPSPDDQGEGQQGGDDTNGSGGSDGSGQNTPPPDDDTSSSPSPSDTGSGSPSPSDTSEGDSRAGDGGGGEGDRAGGPTRDTGQEDDDISGRRDGSVHSVRVASNRSEGEGLQAVGTRN